MVDRDLPVTDDELHAYVDGELPIGRRKTVEAWLAVHPDDAARVAAWRAQAELIRVRYGGAARNPGPAPPNLAPPPPAAPQKKMEGAPAVVSALLIVAAPRGGRGG